MNLQNEQSGQAESRNSGSWKPGGIYLVADPSMEEDLLLENVRSSLKGGLDLLQIWNNWPESFSDADKLDLIQKVCSLASGQDVPVLINEAWEMLADSPLDGVHFDSVPEQGLLRKIRSSAGRKILAGLTCENDLGRLRTAKAEGFDYLSFCAMFPSRSVSSCEIVWPETVRRARSITDLPLFASGGITADNLPQLAGLGLDGVAIISGIMSSESPETEVLRYADAFKLLKSNEKELQ